MPDSMRDIKCVAIAEGGYVAVFDDGDCCCHGIPNHVVTILKRQHFSNISYIALGEHDQYYIRKTNGKELYYGCEEFMNAIASASTRAKLVAFGDYDTYFIVFDDGSRTWSDNLDEILPDAAYSIFTNTSNNISSVWLGEYDSYDDEFLYFIVYNNGNYTYDSIPDVVSDWVFHRKRRTTKMKQVLIGNDGNYFVRFS